MATLTSSEITAEESQAGGFVRVGMSFLFDDGTQKRASIKRNSGQTSQSVLDAATITMQTVENRRVFVKAERVAERVIVNKAVALINSARSLNPTEKTYLRQLLRGNQ